MDALESGTWHPQSPAWYPLLDPRDVPNSLFFGEAGCNIRRRYCRVAGWLLVLALGFVHLVDDAWADDGEVYTHKLSQSTTAYDFWTTPPSEKVFKDSPVPSAVGDEVKVYIAQNETEPFQIVIRGSTSGSVVVSFSGFGSGISTEIHQVKYVNLTQTTDYLGRTGLNPDPLWPLDERRNGRGYRQREHGPVVQRFRTEWHTDRRLPGRCDHRRRGDPCPAAHFRFRHPGRSPPQITNEFFVPDDFDPIRGYRHRRELLVLRGQDQAVPH